MSEPMEWVEIQLDDLTIAFGRQSKAVDQQVYFRVLGKKDGTEVRIEWALAGWWMRDYLTRWFPQLESSPAPRPPREP